MLQQVRFFIIYVTINFIACSALARCRINTSGLNRTLLNLLLSLNLEFACSTCAAPPTILPICVSSPEPKMSVRRAARFFSVLPIAAPGAYTPSWSRFSASARSRVSIHLGSSRPAHATHHNTLIMCSWMTDLPINWSCTRTLQDDDRLTDTHVLLHDRTHRYACAPT